MYDLVHIYNNESNFLMNNQLLKDFICNLKIHIAIIFKKEKLKVNSMQ